MLSLCTCFPFFTVVSPSVCQETTVERMDVEPNPKKPPSKSLRQKHGAALKTQLQPANTAQMQRPRSASHRTNATSPQRSAHSIPYNDLAAHHANVTSDHHANATTTQRIAPRKCNQSQRSMHRIQYNDNAAHRLNVTSPDGRMGSGCYKFGEKG